MKREGNNQPSAYVLGASLNALGVVRCLGRRGIRVRTIRRRNDELASWSRYSSPIFIEPTVSQSEYLEALITVAKQGDDKPVLIPTGDVDITFMCNNRQVLREHFRFILSDASVLDALLDKDQFYHVASKLHLTVPKTYPATDMEQVREISRRINFPCVIKPRYSPTWQNPRIARALGYLKVLECSSPEELLTRYRSLDRIAQDIVIQELIPGGEDNLHDVYVYIGPGGSSFGTFCLQKLRTAPIAGRGGGTLVQSTHNPEIAESGLSFLQAIGYRGPAAVCFKQHAETGQFVAIEVNARLSLHHSLAAHCGLDYAYLLYLDSIGAFDLKPQFTYPSGVKWIAALNDSRSFHAHHAENGLAFGTWLSSLRGSKTFGDWSWNDPWPLIRQCISLVPSMGRQIGLRRKR